MMSRWLQNIDQYPALSDRERGKVNKTQKRTRPIFNNLDRPNFANKEYILRPKQNRFFREKAENLGRVNPLKRELWDRRGRSVSENFTKAIFRSIKRLKCTGGWFPERSANFQCCQEKIIGHYALLVCRHCNILYSLL